MTNENKEGDFSQLGKSSIFNEIYIVPLVVTLCEMFPIYVLVNHFFYYELVIYLEIAISNYDYSYLVVAALVYSL